MVFYAVSANAAKKHWTASNKELGYAAGSLAGNTLVIATSKGKKNTNEIKRTNTKITLNGASAVTRLQALADLICVTWEPMRLPNSFILFLLWPPTDSGFEGHRLRNDFQGSLRWSRKWYTAQSLQLSKKQPKKKKVHGRNNVEASQTQVIKERSSGNFVQEAIINSVAVLGVMFTVPQHGPFTIVRQEKPRTWIRRFEHAF